MHPFLNIFGLSIPTYGLMILLGCIAAVLVARRRGKRVGIGGDDLLIVGACALGLGFIAGTLMFIFITYSWAEILYFIQNGMINQLLSGGIVFYGGLIGGVLGGIIGCAIAKVKVADAFYTILPTVPLGQAFGRVGCFLAGCCYGCETDLPIGVIYTNPVGGAPTGVPLFPIQLLETLLNLILFAVLMLVDKKTFGKKPRMFIPCLYGIGYGVIRFILEYFRYDSIRGFLFGLSTSQWISILIVVLCGIGMILLSRRRKHD